MALDRATVERMLATARGQSPAGVWSDREVGALAEDWLRKEEALRANCEYARDAKANARAEAARTHGEGYTEEMGRANAYADMAERLYSALAPQTEEPR